MSELRLAADSFAYCTMMSAFAKVHKWSEVLLLQDQLENANIEKNTILCSAAINACAKGSLWSLAVNFLASMEEDQIQTNLVTFSSAISACERGEWTWALELLEKMSEKVLWPDAIAFSAGISACGKADQWEEVLGSIEIVFGLGARQKSLILVKLVNCFQKSLPCAKALNLFAEMQSRDIRSDAISLSTMISACEKVAEWEAAIDLLTSHRGANAVSYAACISACEKASQWVVACALLRDLLGTKVELDVFPFGAAIAACSRSGEWQVALNLLNEMPRQKISGNGICYTAAIAACAGNEWRGALELFGTMLAKTLEVNDFTYNAAMSACEVAGRWEESLILLKQMLNQKLPADGMHVGALVGATLRRQGRAVAVDRLKNVFGKDADASPLFSFLPPPKAVEWHGDEVLCSVEGLVAVNKASGTLTENVQLAP